jgi:hypothetical protein
VWVLVLISIAVITPSVVASLLGFSGVGSFVGLAGVGAVVATLSFGLRGGLIAAGMLGVGAVLLTVSSTTWWTAALVMAAIAMLYGLSARWAGHGAFISVAVALSFVASDGAKALDSLLRTAIVLGVAFLIWGVIVTGLTFLVFRKPIMAPLPQPPRVVIGYAAMLTVVTFITQALAIGWDMGHTGAWLVMTPFLVIMPHIRDGFEKSLLRSAGTLGGFLLVVVIAEITSSKPILFTVGAVAFTAAIYAKFRNLNYFYFALFLTPGIVILEGLSTSITSEADYRVVATLGGVALSLAAMGILTFVNRKIPVSSHE